MHIDLGDIVNYFRDSTKEVVSKSQMGFEATSGRWDQDTCWQMKTSWLNLRLG